jgi:hypothetical protein
VLGVVWLALVLAGSGLLWRYKTTPGAPGAPPHTWPNESRVQLAPDVPTLLLFAHPMCPCTRASLDELEVLVSRAGGGVRPYVLLVKPEDPGEDYDATRYWARAASIPGVTPRVDERGEEAARFAAATSGHVLLYAADGRLLYSGGITAARGHDGDNDGLRAILAIVGRRAPARDTQPVFGCSLVDPQPPAEEAAR